MKPYYISFIAVMALCAITFCKSKEPAVVYTGQPTIVYKTKADYSQQVPVTLNAEKTAITAYPAPTDIYYKGRLALPVQLQNGYWLDNRGIGVNSAFLKLTYQQYSKLKQAPALAEMMDMLIDKDPFTEMYNLGDRAQYKDDVAQINSIIKKDGLKKFKRLK